MSPAYEWSVLRVVPRVERCEFANVGVILYCQLLDYLAAAVTADLSRVRTLDPGLDEAGVRRQLDAIRALCAGDPAAGANADRPRGERFRWLVAPRSTVVQPAPVHTGLTDDPPGVLGELYRRMVAPPPG